MHQQRLTPEPKPFLQSFDGDLPCHSLTTKTVHRVLGEYLSGVQSVELFAHSWLYNEFFL
jgi:hypothetical protein